MALSMVGEEDMSLMRQSTPARLAPVGEGTSGPGARTGGADAGACARCGGPLPKLVRRRQSVCRVCATQQAQTYLRHALANRRRRPPESPDVAPPFPD
jgi:hypothetical protein